MKRFKNKLHMFSKENLLRILFSLLFSVLMSLSLIVIGERCTSVKPWLSLIVDVAPEWYMNTFYSNFSAKKTDLVYGDVTLFDLADSATRKDIADVINLVSKYSPKAVGIDYMFPKSENYDSTKTAYLIETINHLPEHIPFVFAHDTLSVFPDSTIRKHHKGHTNFYGFYEFRPHIDTIPHMALAMAEQAGCDISKLDSSSFVVNYSLCDLGNNIVPIHCPLSSIDTLRIAKKTSDRLIIIGSTKNDRDKQKLPYKINGKERYIAGSLIISSILTSILSVDTPQNSILNDSAYHYYRKLPIWINWCLIILCACLYLFFYSAIDHGSKPWKERCQWVIIPIGLLKSILSFIFIVLNLLFYMHITSHCLWIPDVVILLYMTVFMSYFYEMLNFDY